MISRLGVGGGGFDLHWGGGGGGGGGGVLGLAIICFTFKIIFFG
jgi:hypothetical protein